MRGKPNPTPPNEPRLECEPPDGDLPSPRNEDRVHFVSAAGQRFDGADAGLLEWRSVVLRDCSLSAAQLPRWDVVDGRLRRCDLASIDVLRGSLERLAFDGCRLTGASFPETRLVDVTISDCRADMVSLRYATLERVRFEGCTMPKLDLRGARVSDVSFVDCDLTGLDVTEARLRRTHIRGGTLESVVGITGLRGATLGPAEAVGLAHEMASALGIKVAGDR